MLSMRVGSSIDALGRARQTIKKLNPSNSRILHTDRCTGEEARRAVEVDAISELDFRLLITTNK
jgi:hypothetical protein